MRIGIDASRSGIDKKTGTEAYSYQIITHLLSLPEAQKHTWILYIRPGSKLEIRNSKLEIINLPYLWTQAGLAYKTWTDNLDVLWIPAHTLPVLKNPKVKTVVTIHGIEYEWLPAYENPLQRWYLPLSTQFAVASASKIIAVSEFTKSQLVERLQADPNKISVVHEGVDPGILNFKFLISKQQEVLKKYNLEKQQYLIFIGTVQPRKNLQRLVQVFSKLEISNLKLLIVGKLGWGYDDVLAEISASTKRSSIVTLGYINDTDRNILLQNALVYVQPSITEGFGLPIVEAFAAGVPVVSSFGGALREVVGNAGLLFDPVNLEDMQDKLLMVLTSKSKREQLIKLGKQRVAEFSWETAAKSTYSILTGLK